MVQGMTAPDNFTWSQFLNIANTALVIVVGFLFREAWQTIHTRINKLDDEQGRHGERLSSLEAFKEWNTPRRRRSDHSEEE